MSTKIERLDRPKMPQRGRRYKTPLDAKLARMEYCRQFMRKKRKKKI